jgi:hypothetical protein
MPDEDEDGDVLEWWRHYRRNFPGLARVAMVALVVPASSGAMERFFSLAGRTLTALRTALSAASSEQLMYLKYNWDDRLYGVEWKVPKNTEEEQQEEQEPSSESDADLVNEEDGASAEQAEAEEGGLHQHGQLDRLIQDNLWDDPLRVLAELGDQALAAMEGHGHGQGQGLAV